MRILLAFASLVVIFLGGPSVSTASDSAEALYRWGHLKALGPGVNYVNVGAGGFNITGGGETDTSAAGKVELRFGRKLLFVGPVIGVLANLDGGIYGFGGIYADIGYRSWRLSPLMAVGGYRRGESKELGGALQFRLGIGLFREFSNRFRLGVEVAHLSNAGLNRTNPGEEDYFLTLGIPF